MYLYQSVSRVSFACFFRSICTYIYVPRYICVRFDTENIFSLPFVLYLFPFSHAILAVQSRFSLQEENLSVKNQEAACRTTGVVVVVVVVVSK